MENNQVNLQEVRENLQEIIKPYNQQQNQRQRKLDFIRQCIRNVERDNFFQLDEALKTKIAYDITLDEHLNSCNPLFDRLRTDADEKVERYRVQFIDDLKGCAEEVGVPMEIDFPRFTILKGIEGQIDFGTRKTVINKKVLKSIDPKRIAAAALKEKRQLYDKPFDPQVFINKIFDVYKTMVKKEKKALGDTVPIQPFYCAYVLSLQSNTFFQNMDKGKFRGYGLDQLAVDIWRYFQSDIKDTTEGYALKFSSGRNKSLWLIDSDGEKRQITAISFQGKK